MFSDSNLFIYLGIHYFDLDGQSIYPFSYPVSPTAIVGSLQLSPQLNINYCHKLWPKHKHIF